MGVRIEFGVEILPMQNVVDDDGLVREWECRIDRYGKISVLPHDECMVMVEVVFWIRRDYVLVGPSFVATHDADLQPIGFDESLIGCRGIG